jgi:hypothetical protein
MRLYTRQGCCLCEGLQERLVALALPLKLEVVDVDGDPALQASYGLRVPVLAVASPSPAPGQVPGGLATPPEPGAAWRDLPPVPPRLAGERLQAWLAGQGLGLVGRGAVAGAAAPAGPPPADRP